jgi:hypothetical protein
MFLWQVGLIRTPAFFISAVFDSLKHRLPEMTRSQYAIRALDWLFEQPRMPSVIIKTCSVQRLVHSRTDS